MVEKITPGPWMPRKTGTYRYEVQGAQGVVVVEVAGPYTPGFDRHAADVAAICRVPEMLRFLRDIAGRTHPFRALLPDPNLMAQMAGQLLDAIEQHAGDLEVAGPV